MNALTQSEQAEEYINRFALRELVEEWLSRASVECPEDPYQYLIDEAMNQRRCGGGIVTCPNAWCGMKLPASRFAAHQEMCDKSANWVRCVRCNLRVDAAKLSRHRMFCKLECCTFCGEMVLPRMLPTCPYRTIAKAERDRLAAMHRRERRLEQQQKTVHDVLLTSSGSSAAYPRETGQPSGDPSPISTSSAPSNVAITSVTTPAPAPSAVAAPHSQAPLSVPEAAAVEVVHDGTEVQGLSLKVPSTTPISSSLHHQKSVAGGALTTSSSAEQEDKTVPAGIVTVAIPAQDEGAKRRRKNFGDKSTGSMHGSAPGGPDADNAPSVPRPTFPAFLAEDMALRQKVKSYPDFLVSTLTTIQNIWRRNITLHLFREKVFGAVWRHMESAQEGAAGRGKEGAAIRLVEQNIRTERRLSSLDGAGNNCASSPAVDTVTTTTSLATAGAKELSTNGLNGSPKDRDFLVEEEINLSFQSDPVQISDTPLKNGSFMRVQDFEALTRHCHAREVLQFSVVLKIARAAVKVLRQRPLVQHIAIPANSSLVIVGDLHGQMKDLEYVLHYMGLPSADRYFLFNGDFVDRGPYGCEVLMLIYGLLCTYPDKVFLNRGNHENCATNTEYGFMAELYAKYTGHASYLLDAISDSYEVMPLISVIDNRVAVVHGGAPRIPCTLADVEAIGHVRDIPVEQQTTRSEQLLAELLWNDPVEKYRSRQLGINHQGEGWRSSSRGCGVEYLTNITEQFLNNNDLKLIIRSHDVKTAGFELIHKNKSITVFSASNYGGVSGNRGAVAVLTKEAEQPVFHTWFLKEDYRERQQDYLLDDGIDAFLQDGHGSRRVGMEVGSSLSGVVASTNKPSSGNAREFIRTTDATASLRGGPGTSKVDGAVVVTGGGIASVSAQSSSAFADAVQQQQQQQQPKRMNAAMIAEAALLDGDEYICAYYLKSDFVLDDDDAASETSSRSSAFSDSEDRDSSGNATLSNSGVATAAAQGTGRTPFTRSQIPVVKANSTSGGPNSSPQRWPTGSGVNGGGGGSSANSNSRLAAAGSRGTQMPVASHPSFNSQGVLRVSCALAQDASIVIQLQTLQQIRELIYFQRYALLVAFNQVDEMHTGTVYKAEWCVVMRDVLKLDIPWYYICQFLAPRLVVDGAPSVEYVRFLRHFDVCFAIDYRLSWQKTTIQRISSGLDLPEDIINAFCEQPTTNLSGASPPNANAAVTSSTSDAERDRGFSSHVRHGPEPLPTSPVAATTLGLPSAGEGAEGGPPASHGAPSLLGSVGKSWNFASAKDDSETAGSATDRADTSEKALTEDREEWWRNVQLDFKTFAMKVRVLSPAAAAMEDNEIFALFCFFDVAMQGHVYVGYMVDSITAVVDDSGSVEEAELLVEGEIDFSSVAGGCRKKECTEFHPPRRASSSSSSSSSSTASSTPDGEGRHRSDIVSHAKTEPYNTQNSVNNSSGGGICGGGGGRSLLASKLKMVSGKSRLMRPPSSVSSLDDEHEEESKTMGIAHVSTDDDDLLDAHATGPTAPNSGTDDVMRPFPNPPPVPAQDFLVKVNKNEQTKPRKEMVGITTPIFPSFPGSTLGRCDSLHPSSSEETNTNNSATSTRPTVSPHNSVVTEPAMQRGRSSSATNTIDTQTESYASVAAPPTFGSQAVAVDPQFSSRASPAWALPLEYDDDENDPHDARVTAPPEPQSRHATTLSATADTTFAPSTTKGARSGMGSANASNSDDTATVKGSPPRALVRSDPLEKAPVTAVDDLGKNEPPAPLAAAAGTASDATSTGVAAPSSLLRGRTFNEYATSMGSGCSVSEPGMDMWKPFDDYCTGLLQLDPINGAGDAAAPVDNSILHPTLEQRVNKRLAMPPWIYPTLLRVQEQLLGGYGRLRFLFQALNRSHNGYLTESEFFPLMEFMNCLLEHPLSATQAHMLFIYVHDSAINYVQSMRNRRRQQFYSGLYNIDGADFVSTGKCLHGMSPSGSIRDNNSYARHRHFSEQVRGERYISLMEFLAFFGVKPMQHEDEVEALEELLYEMSGRGISAVAATAGNVFADAAQVSSTDGMDKGQPFGYAVRALDAAGASLSSASPTASTGVPAFLSVAASGSTGTTLSTEKYCPVSKRAKTHSMEVKALSPNVAVAATTSGRRRCNSTAVLPVPATVEAEVGASVLSPHPSYRLNSDPMGMCVASNNSINGCGSLLGRPSSTPLDNGGALIPMAFLNATPGSRHHGSSTGVGANPKNNSSSGNKNNNIPPMQMSLRGGSALVSPVPSGGDSADHQPQRTTATPMNVFTALASLRDVYGEDITLRELMQRLSSSPHLRRSRIPPQPQDLRSAPMDLGTGSFTSFTSDMSGTQSGSDKMGDDATSPPVKAKRYPHPQHRSDSLPHAQQQQQLQSQRSKSQNLDATVTLTGGFAAPLSFSRTPMPSTASLESGQTHSVLRHSPRSGENNIPHIGSGIRVESHGSIGIADPECSLISLQATTSQQRNVNRYTTAAVSPSVVPAAPPTLVLSQSRCGMHNSGHNQHSDTALELSVTPVSVRPYVLNQTVEQRITMPFNCTVNPSFAVHATPPMNFVASTSNSCSKAADHDGGGLWRGMTGGVPVPAQDFRYPRQRVHGSRPPKHGATKVLVSPMNSSRENEFVSMSLVPTMMLPPAPPAPPTRQRSLHNGSSATLSDASRASSVASDHRDTGGSALATQQYARRPPSHAQRPTESTTATTTVAATGTSSKNHSGLKRATSGLTNKKTSAPLRKDLPQSTPQNPLSPLPEKPIHDGRKYVTGTPKLAPETNAFSKKKRKNGSQTPPHDVVPTGVAARAAPPAARASPKPLCTKAKLNNCIAAAKAMQIRSRSSSPNAASDGANLHSPTGPSANNNEAHDNSNCANAQFIPAPPPLQPGRGDTHDHTAETHSKAISPRPTQLPSHTKSPPPVKSEETVTAESTDPLFDVDKSQPNNRHHYKPLNMGETLTTTPLSIHDGDHRGAGATADALTERRSLSTSVSDSGQSCSIVATVTPPASAPRLLSATGVMLSGPTVAATPAGEGSPSMVSQTANSNDGATVAAVADNAASVTPSASNVSSLRCDHRGIGKCKKCRKRFSSGTVGSHSTTMHVSTIGSSSSSSQSMGPGGSAGRRMSVNVVDPRSPISATSRKGSMQETATTSTAAAAAMASPLVSCATAPTDGEPLMAAVGGHSRKSNQSSTRKSGGTHSNEDASADVATAVVAVEEPPVPSAPPGDKAAANASPRGRSSRLPPPVHRTLRKAAGTTTSGIQKAYGTAVNGSDNGDNGSCGGNGRGTTMRGGGAVTAASNTSATQQQSPLRHRVKQADRHDSTGGATLNVTPAPCPPSHLSIGQHFAPSPITSELSENELSPIARPTAAVRRQVRGRKGRKMIHRHVGGNTSESNLRNSSPLGSGDELPQGQNITKHRWSEKNPIGSLTPTVNPLPPSLAKPNVVSVPPHATYNHTSSSSGGGGSTSSGTHSLNLEPLPAIERGSSVGENSSGGSSPFSGHIPHEAELPSTRKTSPLPPFSPKHPITTTTTATVDINSIPSDTNAAAATSHSDNSAVSAPKQRTAAQGPMDARVHVEDPRMLSPSHPHRGPILAPLGPPTKR